MKTKLSYLLAALVCIGTITFAGSQVYGADHVNHWANPSKDLCSGIKTTINGFEEGTTIAEVRTKISKEFHLARYHNYTNKKHPERYYETLTYYSVNVVEVFRFVDGKLVSGMAHSRIF